MHDITLLTKSIYIYKKGYNSVASITIYIVYMLRVNRVIVQYVGKLLLIKVKHNLRSLHGFVESLTLA